MVQANQFYHMPRGAMPFRDILTWDMCFLDPNTIRLGIALVFPTLSLALQPINPSVNRPITKAHLPLIRKQYCRDTVWWLAWTSNGLGAHFQVSDSAAGTNWCFGQNFPHQPPNRASEAFSRQIYSNCRLKKSPISDKNLFTPLWQSISPAAFTSCRRRRMYSSTEKIQTVNGVV